jgi:hypothetical protein
MLEPLTGDLARYREELWAEGREIIQKSPQTWVEVDVEADGPPWWGNMTALGVKSPFEHRFYTEIKPANKRHNPGQRAFCEAHKLEHERLLIEAPTRVTAMRRFHAWLLDMQKECGGKPLIMSVGNKWFDFAWVDRYFSRAQLVNPFTGVNPLDLQSLSMFLSDNWDWTETEIGRAPRVIVPDRDFTHNALEDAEYQQLLHFGLAALITRVKKSSTFVLPSVRPAI